MANQEPAGEYVIRKCNESKLYDNVLDHFHIKQIAHDNFQKWHAAESDMERIEITKEYHRQLSRALLLALGITMGTAVVINSLTEYLVLGLFVTSIAISYYINK